MNEWRAAGASVVGRKHLSEGARCQDSTEVRLSNGFVCVAISDGAGSASRSKKASEILTRQVSLLLKNKFDVFYDIDVPVVKRRIIEKCVKKIGRESRYQKVSKSEFSATLLFVAIKSGRYIAGHIGDGAIAIYKDGKLNTLSAPSNGQYRNETFFVSGHDAIKNFRLYRGTTEGVIGFALATDGTTDSLFDYKKLNFAPIVSNIINWLQIETSENVTEAIRENLKSVVSSKTKDDCSLGVLRVIMTG